MIIVAGKQTSEMSGDRVAELTARYARVTIDLGAGDGRFAYAYAKAHADRFVIAIDPVRETMREISAKAARKTERGGLANVLYVVASIEQAPAELYRVADEIFITLPWGSLMRGIIAGDAGILGAIASLGVEGASVRIILNARIFDDPVPIEVRDLPETTPDHVLSMRPAYKAAGLRVLDAAWAPAEDVAALGTTWAKRLSHRSPPRSVRIDAAVMHSIQDSR